VKFSILEPIAIVLLSPPALPTSGKMAKQTKAKTITKARNKFGFFLVNFIT
jgi:hypothetical protein